ncbi:RagB/SusD family nutrient uptake outer membrane protein [Proteiniphilum sp. X52]|uniref:RagB/SusD family nutrient uptake outer membrane protein n=1 Tax=Proteiniphilum sp. X52 TaxID=2382159 RepID=UPI000F09E0DD|nr:RagB/SusD family nutrient uptake outer membrane protein [Proteiniphilum sp. X52]RNC67038.1 RagB/SusD family nutrient uptake outer membrane protein [Proteiniphilum sp. X52]
MKKNSYIVICLSAFVSFFSCSDFLDPKPTDFLFPGNYYQTEDELNTALTGVYDALGNGSLYGNNALYLFGWEADEGYMNRSSISTGAFRSNHSSGDSYLTNLWNILFSGINRANLLLASVDNNPDIDLKIRDNVRGQALFLRGYFYFILVQNFGGVPIKTTPSNSVKDVHIPRNTVKEVYDQILSDMTAAEPLVQDISDIGFGGRVSKSAVRGILARVCLTMAGYPLQETARYADAANWAKKVIDDGTHSLNPSFPNIFITLAQDKYDIKESIFEVEFWGNGTDSYNEYGRNGWINGVYSHSSNNATVGRSDAYMSYSHKLYSAYEVGDNRKYWCIPHFRYVNNTGAKTLISAPSFTASYLYRSPGKFRREYETLSPRMATYTPQNVQLLRYADVLLMYAEALNEANGGPTPEAIDAVNQVRRRAWSTGIREITVTDGGSGYTSAPTVTISGGGGSGAKAVATVRDGVVTRISLVRDSTGVQFYQNGSYTSEPTVTISGGEGSGATATASIFTPSDADVTAEYTASREKFREFIQNERLRELCFENQRKADLIRWGIYYEAMQAEAAIMQLIMPGSVYISYYTNVEVPKHLLYPIPDVEMINNTAMTQNPGW